MPVIDEIDTAQPVTVIVQLSLDIVLASDKIPHEITAVHITELVVDHEFEVLTEGRPALAVLWNTGYRFVIGHNTWCRVYHAGYEPFVLIRIIGQGIFIAVNNDIFTCFFILLVFRFIIAVRIIGILFAGFRIIRIVKDI